MASMEERLQGPQLGGKPQPSGAPMPRYFFHVNDGVQQIDREGTDLHGPEKAHSEGVIMAGEMLKDVDGHFTRGNWSLRVIEEGGGIVSDIMIVVRRKKPPA